MLARMKFHGKDKMKFGTKQGLHAAVTLSLCELCQKHVVQSSELANHPEAPQFYA